MKSFVFKYLSSLSFILFLAGCSSGIQQDLPVTEDVIPLAAETLTVTFQVKASADDAEEPNGRAAAVGSTELELGVDAGVARQVGVRFSGVTIPKGARIDSAVLELKAAQSTSTGASFTVVGEASDNAAAYANVVNSIKGRIRTQASLPWQPTTWTLGVTYRTGDFKAILQEIVNRSNWQSGNAAAFMITGTGIRDVVAFDGAAANAPKLVVTYTYDSVPPPPSSSTIIKAVAQSADDAEEPNGRAAAVGSTVLELGVDTSVPRVVGMRFSNLAIPVGARIDGAVIEMVAAGSNSETSNLTVVGEAADNAAAYANVAGSISGRPKTQTSAAWSPPAWTAGTTHAYRTGELKSILQEIVNRPGWKSGNAAALMITGTGARKAAAFESGAAKAPRLVVSYTPSTTPPPPPPPPNPCSNLSGTLPAPWQSADLGTVSAAGKAASTSDTFDLCGYGSGLAATTDSFHFVHQTLTGDGTLTARVVSLDAATADAQAGVMVRETLDAGSKYAAVTLAAANQTAFASRGGTSPASIVSAFADLSEGKASLPTASVADLLANVQGVSGSLTQQVAQLAAPYWVRITRRGESLNGYTSSDGQTWQAAGTATIAMTPQVYVGLILTGKGNAAPATARFDNVSVGPVVPTASVTKTVDASGGRLFLEDVGVVEVQASFLTAPTELTFSSSSERPTQYPEEFRYLLQETEPVAPNVTLSLPTSAVNRNASDLDPHPLLQFRVPATTPFKGTGLAEIRYLFEDGSFELALEPYRVFDAASPSSINDVAGVSAQSLLKVIDTRPEQIVRINIQPVRVLRWAVTSQTTVRPTQVSGTATTRRIEPNYVFGPATVDEGLYKVTDGFNYAALDPSNGDLKLDELPEGIVPADPSSNTGKRNLVIVHGFQGFTERSRWRRHSVPVGFANETALEYLAEHPELRDVYDVYLFGYDSRGAISDKAELLKTGIERTFLHPVRTDIMSYSLGGNVVHDYMSSLEENNFANWVSLATPFRGVEGIYCEKIEGGECTRFGLRPDDVLRGNFISELTNWAFSGALAEWSAFSDVAYEFSATSTYYVPPLSLVGEPTRIDVSYEANPYLQRINSDASYPDFTTIFSDSPSPDGVNFAEIFGIVLPSEANDGLVGVGSACFARDGKNCSDSVFGNAVRVSSVSHQGAIASVGTEVTRALERGPDCGPSQGARYCIVALPPGDAMDINERGEVTGFNHATNRAYIYDYYTKKFIYTEDGNYPQGVNIQGAVLFERKVWQPDAEKPYTDLPGGDNYSGVALNDANQVVGHSRSGNREVVRWLPELQTFPNSYFPEPCSSCFYNPWGDFINKQGTALVETSFTNEPAYLWSIQGEITQIVLPVPGKEYDFYDLNDHDEFIGRWRSIETDTDTGQVTVGDFTYFRYRNGGVQALCEDPPYAPFEGWDFQCSLSGMNNRGDVVGEIDQRDGPLTYDTFLWPSNASSKVNLESLIDSGLGWDIQSVTDINDQGDIIGEGYLNGDWHAFLMISAASRGQ